MEDNFIIPGRYCCFKNHFKPVTHVIFDLDGTILDTEKVDTKILTEMVVQLGMEYSDEIRQSLLGMNEYDICKNIVEKLELKIELEEFLEKYKEKTYKLVADVDFMPGRVFVGAVELITHLHEQQIPLAIATSSAAKAVEYKISKKRDLFNMFHHIVCGDSDPEVLQGKPKPNIYYVAARRFPDRPRRNKCLVFEDSFNGVMAAIGAGMQVVMIPEYMTSYDKWKYATMRLDSLEQFIPELFGLPALGSPIP